MARSSSLSTVNLPLAAPGLRLLLLIPVILAALGGWFSTRWYLGNTIAEAATTGETPSIDLARLAVRWAPSDSFVHWRLGVMAQKEFSASNLEDTVRTFEAAVRHSPNDFRYWDELGRALESAGDSEGAERALRRATDLAPSYSYPRWHFGNALLRAGKLEEAFPHLFRAAEANDALWPQVLNLAWQAYDEDVDRIANEACKDPAVRTGFAIYLVGLKRFDDAVRLWKTLSSAERQKLGDEGRGLRKALFEAKQFHAALDITRDLETLAGGEVPVAETISNGGFESGLVLPVAKSFGWTIASSVSAQISLNYHAHRGQHSLRIVFSAPGKLDRINVSQTIVVQPNTQYHFECYARTEKLNSASTTVILIVDAADQAVLATSTPLPTGTKDWQRFALDFKTKNSQAITILIGRLPCSVGDVCPMFGTVWYDDFNLERGSGGPVRTPGAGEGNNPTNR
jgi:tetratricopeptide (TPR) repeat protein